MIVVEQTPFTQMKAHAGSIFPDECCGFLFGSEFPDGTRTITKIREVDNAKPGDKKRRFEITGKDYIHAELFASENGLLLLGVYHSHPNHPAIPSEHDRVAAQPYFSYVIISVMQGRIDHIRSWRLNDNSQFDEENFSPVHINQSI
jgi:proteasome lid subunit RPN8/RPN11